MSAREAAPEPAPKISLDDLKHRAETVKDMAVSQSKEATVRVMAMDASRKVLIVAGVAVALISLAYLAGTRSGRCRD